MNEITAADLVTRITWTDDTHTDVRTILADRINCRAVVRQLGASTDDNEIKAYAIAYVAARRLNHFDGEFVDFAARVADVSPYSRDGQRVTARRGVLYVKEATIAPPSLSDRPNAG